MKTASALPVVAALAFVAGVLVPVHAQTWPTKAPHVVINTLYQNSVNALQAPETRERLGKLGAEPMLMTPAEFDAHIRKEIASNAALVKAAGITVNQAGLR